MRGPVLKSGMLHKNVYWLVPADPQIIGQFPSRAANSAAIVEHLLTKGMLRWAWKKLSRISPMDLLGKTAVGNISPGSYILWVNEFTMITYLYKVNIQSGETTVVHIDNPFFLTPLKFGKQNSQPDLNTDLDIAR